MRFLRRCGEFCIQTWELSKNAILGEVIKNVFFFSLRFVLPIILSGLVAMGWLERDEMGKNMLTKDQRIKVLEEKAYWNDYDKYWLREGFRQCLERIKQKGRYEDGICSFIGFD